MFISALIIYTIGAFLAGPTWPLDLIAGKAGPIGIILVIGWILLLIAGITS